MSEKRKEEMKSASKTTESGDAGGTVSLYPKVDFHAKESPLIKRWYLAVIYFSFIAAFCWKIFDSYYYDLYYSDRFSLMMIIILVFYLFITVLFWYKFFKHKNSPFLMWSLGMTISFMILVFYYSITQDPINESHWKSSYVIILFFSLPASFFFMIFGIYRFMRLSPLSIYPRIIVSAERGTDEYLNGYSRRPISAEFSDYDKKTMKKYTDFLMHHMLLWDAKRNDDRLTLFLPVCGNWTSSLIRKKSYVTILNDGKTQAFITPEDYSFLKVPISYHLLCENIVERIWSSYELFVRGKKNEAIQVFNVERRNIEKRGKL